MSFTLIPAYGRDYKSVEAVKLDFYANKDFYAQGPFGRGYINRTGIIKEGLAEVAIRYSRLSKVVILAVDD